MGAFLVLCYIFEMIRHFNLKIIWPPIGLYKIFADMLPVYVIELGLWRIFVYLLPDYDELATKFQREMVKTSYKWVPKET